MNLNISLIVLIAVFVFIAVRKIGTVRFQIWQVMLIGAIAVLVTGQISVPNAVLAINLDVMFFLIGMFIVGEALTESGYLTHISHRIFKAAKTPDQLLLLVLFAIGLLSTILMNDTLAIIGTPLMLHFAKRYKISYKPLLLALAFAVTIGSVMSPIGNPQNLLVAITADVKNPFLTFLKYLLVPTIINLFIAYGFLRLFYKDQFVKREIKHKLEPITDEGLARLCKVSLIIIAVLVVAKVLLYFIAPSVDLRLTYIALIAAAPIVFLSPRRLHVLSGVDWKTLVFFASMFVLMRSVWDSNFFQDLIKSSSLDPTSVPMIFLTSVVISQFVSNVPFVALFTPLLLYGNASTRSIMALAAGSTIAGNLTILGAASNVIIIQNAEKQGKTLTFVEFAKIGIPLTLINVLVYWGFLMLF